MESIKSGLILQNKPRHVVEDVVAGRYIGETRLSALNTFQRSALRKAEAEISAAKVVPGAAAACGFGLSPMIVIGSFVGGLVGWLLVMRKTLLQCFRCAVVGTS
jgi:hypothetical protein